MANDITIYVGESAIIRVAIVDQNGNVKNLVAATISFRIGDKRAGENALTKAGSLTNNGSDGIIQVRLTIAETSALKIRQWDYQFIATDHDGDVQVVKEGLLRVKTMLPTS